MEILTKIGVTMTVLDLFAGAGGLSEGFRKVGFDFVGHVEMDKNASMTLRVRNAYYHLKKNNKLNVYYDYLLNKIDRDELLSYDLSYDNVINSTIGSDTYSSIVKKINSRMNKANISDIDVIIGGVPCQSYSIANLNKDKDTDSRNFLYRFYVRFLRQFKPKLCVIENVPGIITVNDGKYYRDIQRLMNDAGYNVTYKKLVASDYGVLQDRKRIIIVGWLKKYNLDYPMPDKISNTYTINDVLRDLPSLDNGAAIEGINEYIEEPNDYLIRQHIRDKGFNILTQHQSRKINSTNYNLYIEALKLWNSTKRNLNYNTLALERPTLCTYKIPTLFPYRFKVVVREKPACHTLTAHMATDGHNYIHPDIKQVRSLSIRESARLQSFPDDFHFEGSMTSKFKQIGNAVPPLMAAQIASKIKAILTKIE